MQFSSQLAKLDYAVALERLGGDEQLLQEVARLFLDEYPTMLDGIRQAVFQRDANALERAAHSLKGSVANFGSDSAYQAAFQLEQMGRRKDLAGSDSAFSDLMQVMQQIRPALEEIASAI
jgi:two-component system sensor histidine kinase/response regulator